MFLLKTRCLAGRTHGRPYRHWDIRREARFCGWDKAENESPEKERSQLSMVNLNTQRIWKMKAGLLSELCQAPSLQTPSLSPSAQGALGCRSVAEGEGPDTQNDPRREAALLSLAINQLSGVCRLNVSCRVFKQFACFPAAFNRPPTLLLLK